MNILISMSFMLLFTAMEPQSVAREDFFRKECEAGSRQACEKLEALMSGKVVGERLTARSAEFWKEVDTEALMLDEKRPNLGAAYPLVMRDFIAMEQAAGAPVQLDESRLPRCAAHYHNYWINRKLWYPSTEEGNPDWPSIYEFIVDHYYGFCLKN